ncbi:hypothetical protein GCM10023220_31510 [Streptomyces ziwulingensis]|uniref:HTH lysR-type domain-containing protein n=1 Tax=Streptomyces ziwulingensis TaxID=1045501 RepID=A0ABP9BXC2_9ACTN
MAAELSFTRAAKNLHYAQSTVTTQIKNLEEAVGTELFDRSRRQLTLTEAGRRLLPHAEQIIELAETARRDVAAVTRQPARRHRLRQASPRALL